MSPATLVDGAADCRQPADRLAWMPPLQQRLLGLVLTAASLKDLLHGLADLLQSQDVPAQQRPFALLHRDADDEPTATETIRLDNPQSATDDSRLTRQLAGACIAACRTGAIEVRRQIVPAQTLLAAPLPVDGAPQAIALAFAGEQSGAERTLLVQQLALHLALWQARTHRRRDDVQAEDAARRIELLERVALAEDVQEACFCLAAQLANALPCKQVAIGVRRRKGRCSTVALSGLAQFDSQSEIIQRIEAAMDETRVHESVCCWPSQSDLHPQQAFALGNLCTATGTPAAAAVPLRDAKSRDAGAIVVLCENEQDALQTARFLAAAAPSLAAALGALQRNNGSRLVRLTRAATRNCRSLRGKLALTAVLIGAAAMLIPVPYNVACDCRLEPVTRRFAVAPFDGTLEKSLVKPGDLVRAGDVLARMDGREIRFERAGVVADLQRALKKRDAAQASHNYADQRIAALEAERLELQLQLLDHRAENLEIRSPIDGIVASGDLERAEGAPLTVGQTLFEIGPLDQMIVEVAIPDAEVGLIQAGQPVRVRLDAYPGEPRDLTLARLHPRSEIRDDENVFIAEATVANSAGRLRPGMEGRAKVQTPARALFWVLFHRPWEELTKCLSW